MPSLRNRPLMVAGAVCLLLMAGGCSRVRNHQGFIADPLISGSIAAGVDNRASVEERARPSDLRLAVRAGALVLCLAIPSSSPSDRPSRPGQLVLQVQFDGAGASRR